MILYAMYLQSMFNVLILLSSDYILSSLQVENVANITFSIRLIERDLLVLNGPDRVSMLLLPTYSIPRDIIIFTWIWTTRKVTYMLLACSTYSIFNLMLRHTHNVK